MSQDAANERILSACGQTPGMTPGMTSGPSGFVLLDEVLDEAMGRGRRHDPALGRSGGPAGNARLTSLTGLVLLVVIVAELITLLDVTGLIGWHVGIGIVMIALALLKSASTGWRILGYYTGRRPYVTAGPPPTLLRLLGPLVIVTTLGVLGSGLALIAIGQRQSERPLFSFVGQQISPLTIHQIFFILFAVCTGIHLLARFIPAVSVLGGRSRGALGADGVPGASGRLMTLTATVLASVLAVVLVLPVQGWRHDHHHLAPRRHAEISQR